MISYKEEYLNSFLRNDIFVSKSFKELQTKLTKVNFYGLHSQNEEMEFVFKAKEILDVITTIINKPQVSIKENDTIIRSEQASNIDSYSFLETVHDASLWKRKNGTISPEHVHIKEVSDTYVLYENIFITKVLDLINEELLKISKEQEKEIASLFSYFECENFGYNKYNSLSLLTKNNQPINGILYNGNTIDNKEKEELTKLTKKCSTLMRTPFYKEISTAKAKRKEVIMTNILLQDQRYFKCYKFYKKYVSSKKESFFLPTYRDYVLLKLLNNLQNDYVFNETLNNQIEISFNKELELSSAIYFKDKLFNFSLEKDKDDNGIITTIKSKENLISKNYMLIVLELNDKNYDNIQKKIVSKKEQGFNNVHVIVLQNNTTHYQNIITCSFYEKDSTNDSMKNLFSSYQLTLDCDFLSYQYTCPVCGNKSVSEVSNTFNCSYCKSKWSSTTSGKKQLLWLQTLGGK